MLLGKSRVLLLTAAIGCGLVGSAEASAIAITGAITQSTSDGTGPAVNNPALNNILDADAYSVVLSFVGDITAPGTYSLTGVTFTDAAQAVTESAFGVSSLTITPAGSFDDLSVLACLTTGSDCLTGNQLDANFRILAANLNAVSAAATGLDPPHPLDLLEDDGTTDIQGSITGYSYTGAVSTVPEPSSAVLFGFVLAGLAGLAARTRIRN